MQKEKEMKLQPTGRPPTPELILEILLAKPTFKGSAKQGTVDKNNNKGIEPRVYYPLGSGGRSLGAPGRD